MHLQTCNAYVLDDPRLENFLFRVLHEQLINIPYKNSNHVAILLVMHLKKCVQLKNIPLNKRVMTMAL